MAAAAYISMGLSFLISVCFIIAVSKPLEIVSVTVYYESLCPDSKRFFLNQLGPAYESIATRIQLEFVPYGNAMTHGKEGDYSFSCQHGEEECRGNMIQACAIQILNDTKASLDFINCAFRQAEQEDSIHKCLESTDLQNKVQKCADGKMGKNLLCEMGNLTDSLDPRQTFIPWITLNGKGSRDLNMRINNNFMEVLCEFYKTDLPDPCKTRKRKLRELYRRFAGL